MKKIKKPLLIVGIGGPSGAGKTTAASILSRKLSGEHIRFDNYLKSARFFPKRLGFINWDHPQNLDYRKLEHDLKLLVRGKNVSRKFRNEATRGKTHTVILHPTHIILVEGFMLFFDKKVRKLLFPKIYIDLPFKDLLPRRRKRGDPTARNYIKKIVIPEYKRFGIPQKQYADYIIDGTKSLTEVVKALQSIVELHFAAVTEP